MGHFFASQTPSNSITTDTNLHTLKKKRLVELKWFISYSIYIYIYIHITIYKKKRDKQDNEKFTEHQQQARFKITQKYPDTYQCSIMYLIIQCASITVILQVYKQTLYKSHSKMHKNR